MRMKTIFLFVCCCSVIYSFGQIKLGIQCGYNNSTFSPQTGWIKTNSLNKFQAGLATEIKLKKNFFLQSGLLVSGKGSHVENNSFSDAGSITDVSLYYLQLPLNIQFKYPLNRNIKLVGGAGLYGSMGISGTEKGEAYTIEGYVPFHNKVKYKNSSVSDGNVTPIKPFDAGYNMLAGIEWQNFQLTGSYNYGFVNVYPDAETELKNRVFNISLTYLFSSKK